MKTAIDFRVDNVISRHDAGDPPSIPFVGQNLTLNYSDLEGTFRVLTVSGPFTNPDGIAFQVRLQPVLIVTTG